MDRKYLKKIMVIIVLLLMCILNTRCISFENNGTFYITPCAVMAKSSIDNVITGADNFISTGENQASIDETELGNTNAFLYNILLGIGIIVAIIVGILLGIKYMTGSVEEKAEYKESLIIYVVGCVAIFGAYGIWKLVINILS